MSFDKSSLFKRQHRLALLTIALAIILTAVLTTGTAIAFEDESGSTGLHDTTGVLDQDDQARIEQAIADVEAAGAPTVVYLRLLDTDDDQAVDDGQRLMEAWSVESDPGAHDGFVMFFNLEPDDPVHGEFGIVAGEEHLDDGALPQSELNRIRDEMMDDLADGRLADGIVRGLDLTAERLIAGPPEPTAFESFLDRISSGTVSVLNTVALATAFLLGMIGWRTWRDRPRADHLYEDKRIEPPSGLHPALAGSLVAGNVDHTHIEATLIELARRGAIALEPEPGDEEKVQIRIVDPARANAKFETELLSILEHEAEDGVLDQEAIGRTHAKWTDVQQMVRDSHEQAGWFEPRAVRNQMPLWITGGLGLLLGLLVALVPGVVLENAWPLIGGVSLFVVGTVLTGLAASYPATTFEGARQAVPWRGYREGLKEAASQEFGAVDLDEAFPYIIALGLTDDFHDHLEKANKAGYVPVWVHATDETQLFASNWFLYWVAFHGTMSYQGGSTTTGIPGGAATGSGGAGGRF